MRCEVIRNEGDLEKWWQHAAPLLEKCVKKAVRGEFSVEDIRKMILDGWCVGLYIHEGQLPVFAAAIEIVPYPSGLTIGNVMAVGGRDIGMAIRDFLPAACEWMKRCGCTEVECSVSPAMERLLSRYRDGWKETYRVLRKEL